MFDQQAYWDKRVKTYGRRAVLNLTHEENEYDAVTRKQQKILLPALRDQLRGTETHILDLGCGPGRFTPALAELSGHAIGVDPTTQLLELAPSAPGVEYRKLEEGKLPVRSASMDVVWACLVFGAIVEEETMEQTIREIERVSKPDALLFLVENTEDQPDLSYYCFRSEEEYKRLLAAFDLAHVLEYDDCGERISVLAGRRHPEGRARRRAGTRGSKPMAAGPRVTIVMPDRAGGLPNVFRNLLRNREPGRFEYEILLVRDRGYAGSRVGEFVESRSTSSVSYDRRDNRNWVYRRIRKRIADCRLLVVTNSPFELRAVAMAKVRNPIVHVIHADWEHVLDTAVRCAGVVDAFVAVSQYLANRLRDRGLDRVHHIAQPIPTSDRRRRASAGSLRVAVVGRMVPHKGVARVPDVDRALRAMGVEVDWTLVGDGECRAKLEQSWERASQASFLGEVAPDAVLATLVEQDVLLLLSEREGMPMVVAEAMSLGVVPVVNDLPTGIPQLIRDGESGFICPVGDVEAMARVLAGLDADRRRLDRVGAAAEQHVRLVCDAHARARDYEDLFEMVLREPRAKRYPASLLDPSLLDRHWMPNTLTRAARALGA